MEDRRSNCYWAIVDVEVSLSDHKIHDIGALRYDGAIYHGNNKEELLTFLRNVKYLCGHNIINHDAKYLFGHESCNWVLVDTLYVSPLLFPERPYHRLLKDDKLIGDQLNNPVNDCEKARDLLMDEIARWDEMSERKHRILSSLL
jgi:ATP-dependent DNA helicase RecQ